MIVEQFLRNANFNSGSVPQKQTANSKVASVLEWSQIYDATPKGEKKAIVRQSGWGRVTLNKGSRMWKYIRSHGNVIPPEWFNLGVDGIMVQVMLWEHRNDPTPGSEPGAE